MANAFDTANAPQGEPTEVTAGDLVTWRRDDLVTDYPTADYSLSYSFQSLKAGTTAGNSFTITASEDSKGYYAQIPGATSLGVTDYGDYAWQAYITRTSDSARITVGSGQVTIGTDLNSENKDARSHAQIMLDKIQAVMENRADGDVASYSIQGRSLTKLSPQELRDWRDYYLREVAQEKRKRDIQQGRGSSSTIKVRF